VWSSPVSKGRTKKKVVFCAPLNYSSGEISREWAKWFSEAARHPTVVTTARNGRWRFDPVSATVLVTMTYCRYPAILIIIMRIYSLVRRLSENGCHRRVKSPSAREWSSLVSNGWTKKRVVFSAPFNYISGEVSQERATWFSSFITRRWRLVRTVVAGLVLIAMIEVHLAGI